MASPEQMVDLANRLQQGEDPTTADVMRYYADIAQHPSRAGHVLASDLPDPNDYPPWPTGFGWRVGREHLESVVVGPADGGAEFDEPADGYQP